jgi:hypothetical protein
LYAQFPETTQLWEVHEPPPPIFKAFPNAPEKQQHYDDRDVAMCRGIPELWVVLEGVWKAYETCGNADKSAFKNMRLESLRTENLLGYL